MFVHTVRQNVIRQVAAGLLVPFIWQMLTLPAGAADRATAPSLPQLLVELQRASPDLQSAHKRWEATQARIPLAKALPAPRIGLEWEEIPKGSVKFNQATLMYQLIQSLP